MSSEEKILVSSINGSEKSISLDIEIQKEIEQLEWKDHFLPNVKEVFKIERLTTGEPLRIIASNEAISLINRWIKFLMEKTGSESRTDETLNTLLELLRCLRNCTSNLQTQDYINEKTNILDHTVKLFEIVFKVNKDHLLLKKSIGTKEFWTIYTDFPLNDKTTMLDYFKHLLIQKRNLTIHDEGLRTLVNTILTSSDIIFQTRECSESDQELINEISLTLEILSSLSSDENYLKKLQTNKDLFINAGVLLINVHRLGKEPNSCFTPLQKLSELGKPTEGLKNHPAFGFKADLIRLIGNMCWKNPEMQNLARTAELIPVILDSCNIDARNPFIIQWAILAIRNLLENNIENQKIVADLHQTGVVPVEVLNQLGLTLHSEGENEIRVVPLDDLRKRAQ
ncbi:unnamed protein product [Acanthoscelides obtectus]|uniref:Ataxin-10 n=1 Tax=Acanthoscelides obtectus TaxID=200917 RepID=A0A9P0JQ09_ACAOB|nr:unnamed protein product [Acanthoscelides obtectus]CAK1678470.1 Ataxin-10 [Acanthoscelides obtectus]